MVQNKKFRMPAGIRNKLVAAVAMLLVSSILMVTTTYAWFTLSTAPEVTGITTSVGANGNLEMALLNTDTFADMTKITSGVGNSSAAQAVTLANETWGNLVDLSDASYGLSTIMLQPARMNFTSTGEGDNITYSNKLDTAQLFSIATYGADGRVKELAKALSTIYDGANATDGKWAYDRNKTQYGVRAFGTADSMTAQQLGLINAKSKYNSYMNEARSTMQTALAANGSALADALVALAMNSSATLTEPQQTAIKNLVTESQKALASIDKAYKYVLLAYAASAISDETTYKTAATAIEDATSYSSALEALSGSAGETSNSVPTGLNTAVAALTEQQTAVTEAQAAITGDSSNYTTALKKLVNTESDNVNVSGFKISDIKEADDTLNGDFTSAAFKDLYVEMGEGSGLFAYVGKVAGNYSASCKVTLNYNGFTVNNVDATIKTNATEDVTVSNALNALNAVGDTGATTVLTDTYCYALDLAFRTNAAGSYLLLQQDAANRVYENGGGTATQGSGSNMTFTVGKDKDGNAALTDNQVAKLMQAIRVAFIDPKTGTVYGIATLENITVKDNEHTGTLALSNWKVNPSTGALELIEWGEGADENAKIKLLSLDQNTATRMTVVVYLDGDIVDNSMVANADYSLRGSMNLQFASSAKLNPMENSALKNMTAEVIYTQVAAADADYAFGGRTYTVNTGYTVYSGSDGKVYYKKTGDSDYTELTNDNVSTVLTEKTAASVAPEGDGE